MRVSPYPNTCGFLTRPAATKNKAGKQGCKLFAFSEVGAGRRSKAFRAVAWTVLSADPAE